MAAVLSASLCRTLDDLSRGILSKSFEELVTRAHDMELSMIAKDSAATNAITIGSGHVDGNKDLCNVIHGDNITSDEDTLFEKEDSSDADNCMSTITFTDEDLLLGSKSHNRPLFVAGYVREQKVNRILIDGGSAVNILSMRILKELGIPIDELLNNRLMIQGFNQGGPRFVVIIRSAIDYGGHGIKCIIPCHRRQDFLQHATQSSLIT
ncbi:hypothetical protein Sango_3028500 [Sesamum angolense]|uniref:Uncharacterized protein n=1 Tax=Sesamum angolense TaxID=2727404 RepID=A0AAE1VYU6_9LAMI|nr:hypothetical protein Sango_3028500 [Sesamum angolense]